MTEHYLTIPLKDKDIEKLNINDKVYLSGTIFTARDKAHKFLLDKKEELDLNGGVLYHCGPVVKKTENNYEIIAAGPTTSARMDMYETEIIEKYKIKAIIGKGGMGSKTLNALQKHKSIYLSALGGAAVLAAQSIIKVIKVLKLEEFGVPEALWILEVKDFPTIVTMDSKGNSLHDKILEQSKINYKKLGDNNGM
jgi:tartrate/fumarate subfamily iron-sulfur-dependent hydro-lyase beta chain